MPKGGTHERGHRHAGHDPQARARHADRAGPGHQGPDLSTDTDEITNHDSPDGVEEFIPTIKRTGEITFPLVFLPTDPSHDNDTGHWRRGPTAPRTATSSSTRTAEVDVLGVCHGVLQLAPVDGHPCRGRDAPSVRRPGVRPRGDPVMATRTKELPLLEDAASVLDLADLQDEVVEVPEWGFRLRVRSLTGTERDAFEISLLETRGRSREVNLRNMRAKLVAAVGRKADEPRVHRRPGRGAGRKNAAALQRVFRVAQRLSGLAEDEVDELTAALGEDPSVGSGSD